MRGLELAIRTLCALAESTETVYPSTLWCWDSTRAALEASPRGSKVIEELESLTEDEMAAVLTAVGSFEPLRPLGETYIFGSDQDAQRFFEAVPASSREMFAPNVVNVNDIQVVESFRAPHGGDFIGLDDIAAMCDGEKVVSPLMEVFAWIDSALPMDMRSSGISWDRIEEVLVQRVRRSLSEGVLGIAGPEEGFTGRIARFAVPRKKIGGVDAEIVRALHERRMIPGWAAEKLGLREQDDTVRPGGEAQPAAGGEDMADRGVANERPEDQPGSPAQSQSEPKQEPKAPTEHVPTEEEGGANTEVKLSDGTTIPEPVLKQALAKLLHNLATQVEQGTTSGKPEERKPEPEAEEPEAEEEKVEVEVEEPAAPEEKPAEEEKPPAPTPPAPAPEEKKESVEEAKSIGARAAERRKAGGIKGPYGKARREGIKKRMYKEKRKKEEGVSSLAQAVLEGKLSPEDAIARAIGIAIGGDDHLDEMSAADVAKATTAVSRTQYGLGGARVQVGKVERVLGAQLGRPPTSDEVDIVKEELRRKGFYVESLVEQAPPGVDDVSARELELYIDNDAQLYRQRKSIEMNVDKKMAAGRYNPALAPKLWQYLIDAGARKYVKEFGGEVRMMFPLKLRQWLAMQYAKDYEAELELTEAVSEILAERRGEGAKAKARAKARARRKGKPKDPKRVRAAKKGLQGVSKADLRRRAQKGWKTEATMSERPPMTEQLDVGQEAESDAAAKGFADAAEAIKQLRASAFALTTDSLVRLESLLQSVGTKKAASAVKKLRDSVAKFNDDVKKAAEQLDKANELFKGENGGQGGEDHQAQPEAEAPAEPPAEAPAEQPAQEAPAQAPAEKPAEPAPTPTGAEEAVHIAVGRLARTDIPARIMEGEGYITVSRDIRRGCPDLALTARQVAEVHSLLGLTERMATSRVFSLEMPPADRDLLRSVSVVQGDVPARLVEALDTHGSVSVREDTLRGAVVSLRKYGELRHRLLAEHLERMMSVASAGMV